MKKLLLVCLGLVVVCTFAQTVTSPQRVDWRYRFSWDDPNPEGLVMAWRVCASNSPSQVRYQTTIATTVDYAQLLEGMPIGPYAMSVSPVLDDTTVGEVSTNHFVMWLGKVHPGHNLRSGK